MLETHEDPISYDVVGNVEIVEFWDADNTAEKITKTFSYENLGSATAPLWRKTMNKIEGDDSGLVRQAWLRYTNDGRANLEEKEHWNNNGDNPDTYKR